MPSVPCIIVVEDDQDLRNDLVDFLNMKGFAAFGAATAARLWELLSNRAATLVLLDIGLPDASGLEVAPALHARYPGVGIVMLTAFGEEPMRVEGLEAGADSYLVKGASLELIEATCRSVLRRLAARDPASRPAVQPATDPATGAAWQLYNDCRLQGPNGQQVELTLMEYTLLQSVMRTPGQTVSRTDLLAAMSRPETHNNLRNLDGCVSRLRRKVDGEIGKSLPLRSFYGQGYVFTGPSHPGDPAAP